MAPDLVIVGNLLVDDLVFDDGRTRMGQAGGAVLHAAHAARSCGARVGCVSLIGDEYPTEAIEGMARRGIDLAGVRRLDGRGVRTWLLYENGARQLVPRLGGPTHDAVSPTPALLPPSWRSARAVHLAPMPFASQRAWLEALADGPRPFVSIDPNLPITAETCDAWRDALVHADAFFPADHELVIDGVDRDARARLRRLSSGRLRFLAITRGARGGLLCDAHTLSLHEWTAAPAQLVDPTGAGDAFAMGFVTAHLERRPVAECIERGAVVAARALEAWGHAAIEDMTPADINARRDAWRLEEPKR